MPAFQPQSGADQPQMGAEQNVSEQPRAPEDAVQSSIDKAVESGDLESVTSLVDAIQKDEMPQMQAFDQAVTSGTDPEFAGEVAELATDETQTAAGIAAAAEKTKNELAVVYGGEGGTTAKSDEAKPEEKSAEAVEAPKKEKIVQGMADTGEVDAAFSRMHAEATVEGKPAEHVEVSTPEAPAIVPQRIIEVGEAAPEPEVKVATPDESVVSMHRVVDIGEAPLETAQEKKEGAPIAKFVAEFDVMLSNAESIVANHGNLDSELKIQMRRFEKDIHPDRIGDDPQKASFDTLNGFLKKIQDVAKSDPAKRAEALSAVKAEWQAQKGEIAPSAEQQRGTIAETAAEKLDPKAVEDEAMSFVKKMVDTGSDLISNWDALQDLKEKIAKLEKQGDAPPAMKFLAQTIESNGGNPVGFLESMKEFSTSYSEAGVSKERVDALLAERGKESVKNVEHLANDVSAMMRVLLENKGEVDAQQLSSFNNVRSEFDNGAQYALQDDRDWKTLAVAFSCLALAMRPDASPKHRLQIIGEFIDQFPEAANVHAMTREQVSKTLNEVEAKPPVHEVPKEEEKVENAETKEQMERGGEDTVAAAAVIAAESGIESKDSKEIEAHARMIKRLGVEADNAFASGDANELGISTDNLSVEFRKQHKIRQKKLDELNKIPKSELTPGMQAQVDELTAANKIDEFTLERRQKQLELLKLREEKVLIDAEVASVQGELKAYEGASESDQDAQDLKHRLEGQLAGLVKQQDGLADTIASTEKNIAEDEAQIALLAKIVENAKNKQEPERKKKAEEEKAKKVAGDTSSEGGGSSGTSEVKKGLTMDAVVKAIGTATVSPGEALTSAALKLMNPSSKEKTG